MNKHILIFFIMLFSSQLVLGIEVNSVTSIEERMDSISGYIGGYPPNINSDEEKKKIETEYLSIKNELDKLLIDSPKDTHLLYLRGALQAMGHNFDHPGAWEGASKDLSQSLDINPNNINAILALAELWVNSRPDLAKNAEQLFRGAQCCQGIVPLERAQFGLYFAFYYQGKIDAAFNQAAFLKKTWPNNPRYSEMYDVAKSVLERKSGKKTTSPPNASLVLASCKN